MPWRQRQLVLQYLRDQSLNVTYRAQIYETLAHHQRRPLLFFFFTADFFLIFVVVAGFRATAIFAFFTAAFFFAVFLFAIFVFFATRFLVVVAFFPRRFVAEDFFPDALPPPKTFSQPAA